MREISRIVPKKRAESLQVLPSHGKIVAESYFVHLQRTREQEVVGGELPSSTIKRMQEVSAQTKRGSVGFQLMAFFDLALHGS